MNKIIYILLLLPIVAIGQSTNQNYTKAIIYKEGTSTSLSNPTTSQASIQVAYYDGLGRPIQQISNKQSNTGKNIVTHIGYDQYGRQIKEYLPFKSDNENLEIETDALNKTLSYPQYLNQYPFSEKLLESSPLNRVLKQSAPGTSWTMSSGNEVKFDYQSNKANEVKMYKASATWSPTSKLYEITLVNASGSIYYPPNELYKTITFDENNLETSQNFTAEFKDKDGKVVLKRVNTSTEIFDTYYVYDQYGNLTYVVPPLVNTNNNISTTVLSGLCYQYKYDSRNRLVEKKLPGKQWEFIVYNNLNQPVATGPTKNPINGGSNGWLITKYDVFGRVVHTGWYAGLPPTSLGRLDYQNIMNAVTTPYEERTVFPNTTTIDGLPVSNSDRLYPSFATNAYTLLTVNYYDDFFYSGAPSDIPTSIESQGVNTLVKGLQTGSWIRVLQSGAITGEKHYTLYDTKSRVIRTHKTNHLGGFTRVDSKLDFIGKVNFTITTHSRSTTTAVIKVKNEFNYTLQDRLESHTHQIDDNETIQLLAKNEYDELGQLIVKRVGGTDITGDTPLQKVDYAYNIRGWLKEINKVDNLSVFGEPQDLFSFKINYNDIQNETNYTGTKLYNGNISETYWRTASDNVLRKYGYQYDKLSRLTNAIYQKPGSAVVVTNSYNESLNYDKNGNILSLQRTGEYDDSYYNLTTDNLSYFYYDDKPNQLSKVVDNATNPNGFKDGTNNGNDFTYDDFGNMITDGNKEINEIRYNHLNLPTYIETSQGKINYLYNAVGEKLMKNVMTANPTKTTDYLDGFQYLNSALEFFPHAEGYVKNTIIRGVNSYNYVFNYTDHLGNVRLSYGIGEGNALSIFQENNYYPFGLSHKNYNMDQRTYNKSLLETVVVCSSCPTNYKYKYNGKELQDELGLNIYDYGARNYDPAIGRWMNVDNLAEKYPDWSPYTFALDNPVRYIDPDGNEVQDPIKGYIDKGLKSPTFQKLYSNAGITESNYKSIIKSGRGVSYTDGKGNITIDRKVSENLGVLHLTHELTNRANIEELNGLSDQVANGKISSEDYAYEIVAIESEALINQFVVAKELGINFGEKADGMNQVLSKFASGEISLNQLEELVYSNMEKNKIGGANGQSAIEVYTKQGDDLRKKQQELDKSPKEKKDEKKDEKN